MTFSKRLETHDKKRIKNVHHVTSPEAKTCSGAPISHFNVQRTSAGPAHTTSISKPSSPSAEHISQALKTQRLPTNKEMSSFRMSLISP